MKFFSSNLRLLRKNSGFTQAQIKDRLGIEPTTWSNYERGKSFPNLELFSKISKFFGVFEDALLNHDLSKGKVDNKYIIDPNGKIFGKVLGKIGENIQEKNNSSDENGIDTPLTSTRAGNVYDINIETGSELLELINDREKLKGVETIYVPDLEKGLYFRISIFRDNMYPTIKEGDHVIIKYIKRPSYSIDYGSICILLDKEEGPICKRVAKPELTENSDDLFIKNTYTLSDDNYYDEENFKIVDNKTKRNLKDFDGVFKVVEIQSRDFSLRPALQRLGYFKLNERLKNQ